MLATLARRAAPRLDTARLSGLRPLTALATAGLADDAADAYALAADFAARELAPHSARWDEDKVREEGWVCLGVAHAEKQKQNQSPPFHQTVLVRRFPSPPFAPPPPPGSPR